MRIIDTKVLNCRNIYSHKPVIQLLVDLEDLYGKTTIDFQGFNDKLLEMFPYLVEHHCGLAKHGGFVERMMEGTYFGHVVEHLTLELQVILGYDVFFGKTREKNNQLYNIIVEIGNENVALECVKESINIIEGIISNEPIDLDIVLDRLSQIRDDNELGLSSKAIFDEAKKRGIPVRRLGNESILELGYGKHSRLVQAAMSDSTISISVDISCNKELTKQILVEHNVPVPRGDTAYTLDEALRIANRIKYPVVLKPIDGNQGKGVVLNINSSKELENYFSIPTKYSNAVLVEKYLEGKDYRVLVIKDKICAIAERRPPEIIGDGNHTIRELVDIENRNELRGYGHSKPLTRIVLDSVVLNYLKKNNLSEDSTPAAGEVVKLRANGNISTGGSAIECTNAIHPVNAKFAIDAVKAIGLDIAGVDIIAEDISKPITECGGAIIEINTAPGLRMHLYPSSGNSINVASHILDFLYPEGTPYSIPIVVVTGTNGKTTTTRLISHILTLSGKKVGMTTSSGIYIDNKCILAGDNTGRLSARNVLNSKEIDAAVLEFARGGIIKRGLGYDLADVAVLTNIGDDHIGLDGVEDKEDMAFVKSLVLEAVKTEGYSVINADDEMAEYLINRASGNLILFTRKSSNEIISKYIDDDAISLFIKNNSIYISHGKKITHLINLGIVPITFNGTLECNIENVLAASAALLGLGIPLDIIRFKGS